MAAAQTLAERVAAHHPRRDRRPPPKPGDAVREIEHARRLGVPRGIVREGRRQLVAAGLIEVANGRRAVVSKLRGAPLDGFLANAVATRQLAVDEVLELRQAIEIAVAGLAARRRTAADVAALARLAGQMRATVGRTAYLRHDLEFHLALARATQNPLFVMLIESMREPLCRVDAREPRAPPQRTRLRARARRARGDPRGGERR